MSKLLTEKDYENAAKELNVEVAAIKAVAEIESLGDGFLDDGRPKILFESHIFSKFTDHKYDASHNQISSKRWNRKLYKGGKLEYNRLEEAMELNKEAALKSASWGKFQVMGFNAEICGWDNVESFVDDMYKNEGEHLKAFIGFIKYNKLAQFIQHKNWAGFAERYNGSGYQSNQYDIKMKNAYEKYKKEDDKKNPVKKVKEESKKDIEEKKEKKEFGGGNFNESTSSSGKY